jgi:hypothetical protein
MNQQKLKLSNLKVGIISKDIKFRHGFNNVIELKKFKDENKEITKLFWVTLPLKVDEDILYNPKSFIFKIMN